MLAVLPHTHADVIVQKLGNYFFFVVSAWECHRIRVDNCIYGVPIYSVEVCVVDKKPLRVLEKMEYVSVRVGETSSGLHICEVCFSRRVTLYAESRQASRAATYSSHFSAQETGHIVNYAVRNVPSIRFVFGNYVFAFPTFQ